MSAGRDVERQISAWLTDEASDRPRDRVLVAVREAVDRMPQRRFPAAWREPVYLSPFRMAAVAAALAVSLVGAAYLGRATAPGGAAAQPSSSPSSSAAVVTLDDYRAGRDAICRKYGPETNPLKDRLGGIYDPETRASDRADAITALTQIVTNGDDATADIAHLSVPPEMAVDAALALDRMRQQSTLLHQELALLAEGDLAGAESLDLATDPLSRQIADFERKYEIAPCP